MSATIDSDGEQTRISCSAEVDESRVVDTAPLLPLGIEVPERTRDTLTEAAAQVLIEKLDGKLTVHPHMHRNTLEFICQLPSAAP